MRMPATALAVLALLAGCSQAAATPTPLPAAALVVSMYFADLAAHDCQAAYALLADPLRTRVVSEDQFCIESRAATTNRSTVINATRTLSATRDVVTLTVVKADGSRRQDDVTVVRVAGRWKVSDIAARSAAGATLFDVDAALTQIRNDYGQKTGLMLTTLSCDQHGSVSVVAGQTITCAFVDTARTAGTLIITIGADGNYTWATSNPTQLPSAQASASA